MRYQNKLITQRSTNKLPTTVIPYLKSSVTPEPSADKYQQTYRPSEAKREGWVTYTDYENNYSLSYSSNIYQKQNCIDEGFLLAKNSSVEKETALKKCGRDFPYNLEINIYPDPPTTPSLNDPYPKPSTIPATNDYYKVTSENIIIDNINSVKYSSNLINIPSQDEFPWRKWFIKVFIEKNGKFYEIYFGDKDNLIIFDQILSTLRFNSGL